MKPRRRRGRAADGTGATRAAGTRLNWSPLQRVDEVGVHRVRRLNRAVDLSLGFPEITGGLDVVVDLSGGALRAHDRLARLQIEQRERVEVRLHVLRALVRELQAVPLEDLGQEPLGHRALVARYLLPLQILDRLDSVLRHDAVTADRGVDGKDLHRGYSVGLRPGKGIDGGRHSVEPTGRERDQAVIGVLNILELDVEAVALPRFLDVRDVDDRVPRPGRGRDVDRAGELAVI